MDERARDPFRLPASPWQRRVDVVTTTPDAGFPGRGEPRMLVRSGVVRHEAGSPTPLRRGGASARAHHLGGGTGALVLAACRWGVPVDGDPLGGGQHSRDETGVDGIGLPGVLLPPRLHKYAGAASEHAGVLPPEPPKDAQAPVVVQTLRTLSPNEDMRCANIGRGLLIGGATTRMDRELAKAPPPKTPKPGDSVAEGEQNLYP